MYIYIYIVIIHWSLAFSIRKLAASCSYWGYLPSDPSRVLTRLATSLQPQTHDVPGFVDVWDLFGTFGDSVSKLDMELAGTSSSTHRWVVCVVLYNSDNALKFGTGINNSTIWRQCCCVVTAGLVCVPRVGFQMSSWKNPVGIPVFSRFKASKIRENWENPCEIL